MKRNIFLIIGTIIALMLTMFMIMMFIIPRNDDNKIKVENISSNNEATIEFEEEDDHDDDEFTLLESHSSESLKIITEDGKIANIDNGWEKEDGDFKIIAFGDSGDGNSGINVFLPYKSKAYTISDTRGNSQLELTISYPNILSSGKFSNGNSITFKPDGMVILEMNNSDYKIKHISDITEWVITVTGKRANNISFSVTNEGILLKGDNLEDITVISGMDSFFILGEGDEDEREKLEFSTNKKEVFIKIDGNKLQLVE